MEAEGRLFRRFSVFVGGCILEGRKRSATQVEYALERLTDSGEQSATRWAHAAHCLVLAEEGNPELRPAGRARWLTQCDIEIDNFRSALDWHEQTGDPTPADGILNRLAHNALRIEMRGEFDA